MTTTRKIRTKPVFSVVLLVGVAVLIYFAVGMWQRSRPRTAGPIRVTAQPQEIWIEAGDAAQSLNFDFLVENQGDTPLGIDSIEITAHDAEGKPVLRRFIDSNGFAPSIDTVPGRVVAAGSKILVFNPFHSFRPDVDLHRLTYKFSLSIPQEAPEASAVVTVEPRVYRSRTALSLPVKGKLLIHDGHDFYAHHRRLNTEHPAARDLGLAQNFMRYSLDINPTDELFEPFRDTGAKNEDWVAWGRALYATGDGTVIDAVDVEPDNIRGGESFFKGESVKASPMKFYGNYVLIDHGNGEYSLLGHVQKGSLSVKTGDKVTRGQQVAKIGSSGSSNNPHVHYELRTGKDLKAEGLPATFQGFSRHLGAKIVQVEAGPVDTGDMLESR
ncbi:MAG: M23 family metallopeptidase [Byssovorax sp.]